MKKLVSVLKNAKTKTAAVATAALASGSAMAADPANPVKDSLDAAIAAGQSNFTIVVVGAIGLAAIGFGMGMIISAMRK
ncbi:hypothetical protein MHO82_24675 [Vibrio sp. Of7-15]|uniref:hypothetical protein n=1 Tax=Vibrio sp. Of7-15 TaxID=2724879 RepID=UPI001EF2D507|nr:hypothetical protein [Vibrio sp. Of7-15]MCG7500063.1 hypothetical protein [Vibrio sp. Of7-15]